MMITVSCRTPGSAPATSRPTALPGDAEASGQVIELESSVLKRTFAVRSHKSEVGWMIWLLDVTEGRQLEKRLEGIDKFCRCILKNLETIARDGIFVFHPWPADITIWQWS